MPKEIKREIGLICKEARKKAGLKQSDVAEYLKLSRENVSAFENGRNDSYIILLYYIDNILMYVDIVELCYVLKRVYDEY